MDIEKFAASKKIKQKMFRDIKQLIGNDKPLNALRETKRILYGEKKYLKFEKECLIIESKLNNLLSESRKGTIRYDEYLIVKSQVNNSILELLNELEVVYGKNEKKKKSKLNYKASFEKLLNDFKETRSYLIHYFSRQSFEKDFLIERLKELRTSWEVNIDTQKVSFWLDHLSVITNTFAPFLVKHEKFFVIYFRDLLRVLEFLYFLEETTKRKQKLGNELIKELSDEELIFIYYDTFIEHPRFGGHPRLTFLSFEFKLFDKINRIELLDKIHWELYEYILTDSNPYKIKKEKN